MITITPTNTFTSHLTPRPIKRSQLSPCRATKTPTTAREVALAYYNNYNSKNIQGVLDLIADDCIYEDLVYQDPFVGKTEISDYFNKLGKMLPTDVVFCVEDITDGDPMKVGVRWHVEIGDGVVFPFSRGTSFYQINDQGQIIFARDIVEPSIKPGSAALNLIGILAPLVRKLGPAADPSNLKYLPIASIGMFSFWGAYISYVMLSTAAPGLPVWQTTPETLQSVIHESYNFFYVNIAMAQFGLNPVPNIAEHPVSEALFNFVNAWSLLLLPMMVMDPLGKKVEDKTKLGLWVGTMFLTNVFFPIYMALRLVPDQRKGEEEGEAVGGLKSTSSKQQEVPELPWYSGVFAATAGVVGATSLVWAVAARPEFGDLIDRWTFLTTMLSTNRVEWAFAVDAGLYSVWQAVLLGAVGASASQRFVPFFGAVSWLLTSGSGGKGGGDEK